MIEPEGQKNVEILRTVCYRSLENAFSNKGMTNGVCAFVTNKNPMLFFAHEQQTIYASMCTNAEFSYFMFMM